MAPDGDTKVSLLQDSENIYIGIKVSNTGYQPKARVSRREDIDDDDQIGIYIDTVGDARSGYIFYFNPLGIQQDIRYSNGSWFRNWSTVYRSKGHVTEDGYEIEIAIPFRSLQYPETNDPNWTLIVTRKIPDIGEKYSWPQLKRSHPRLFSQGVPITGITPPPQRANIQIQPSFSAFVPIERTEQGVQIPDDLESSDALRPSGDLRWGITANSGLTATINPDFSQVEGDVRQLNLNQRFAFFYPEQRPFFLDKVGFFNDRASSLYSRSLNDPLYGVKIAGTERNLDFGLLNAIDRSPMSSFNEQETPGFSTEEVEDTWAINSFLRLRSPIKKQGHIGITAGEKRLITDPNSDREDRPTGFSDLFSADFLVPMADIWTISGYSSSAYTGDQQTKLLGNSSSFGISRSPDIGWGGSFAGYGTTKDYRQELGFNTQSGNVGANSLLSYATALNDNSFSTSSFFISHHEEYTGNYSSTVSASQNFTLNGIHSIGLEAAPIKQRYKDFELLGHYLALDWSSRPSSKINYALNFDTYSEIDYQLLVPSTTHKTGVSTSLRPLRNLRIDSTFNQLWYTAEEQERETASNIYNRVSLQLSREWGIRIIEQTGVISGVEDPIHNGSVMFTWLKSPGTAAYIGSTWKIEEQEVQEQIFFAKYTHLFWL